MNIVRVLQTLDAFNEFGKTENGISRIAYSDEEQKAKEYFIQQCENLGMSVTVDPVGNIIARLEGINDLLPAVAIGSHLDTVYNGGKFDGVLGVVAGLEVARGLVEEGVKTLHPIEIISFSCEESSRFNFSTLGSKAMIGDVTLETLKTLKDRDDIPIEEAFSEQKLNLGNYKKAERNKTDLKVFYELHIEQGSRLIESAKTIGLVTGIAAPLRLAINIKGKSSHSGTTGMKQRKDALLAASELTMIVERAALEESKFETVATVGVLDIYPSAMNVIPGIAKLKIDIRSTDIHSRYRVLNRIKDGILLIQKKRGVSVSIDWMHEEEPVLMDKNVTEEIASICRNEGLKYMFMPSGAGHDAMNMAKRWPASMIFIPSFDGLSHHPDEYTDKADIAAGIELLEKVVRTSAIISTGEECQHGITSSQNYLKCEGK